MEGAREEHDLDESFVEEIIIEVDPGQAHLRVDKFLGDRIAGSSRTKIQQSIKNGNVTVNGVVEKANYKVHPGDVIRVIFVKDSQPTGLIAEDIPLDIVYEDEEVLLINKPAGMVVHPGQGNVTGTLVNALMHHIQNLPVGENGADRPGIVHRLDKLTTGLMIIGKTENAMAKLAKQFYDRDIERKYVAICWGDPGEEGRIEGNIGRSLKNRKLMSVFPEGDFGKVAATNFRRLKDLGYVSLVECKLDTGRTHQIRVHFRHINHPIFGDLDYDGTRLWKGTTFTKYRQFVNNCLTVLNRQALHAKSLGFTHPKTGEWMHFEVPMPDDMKEVITRWENYLENRID